MRALLVGLFVVAPAAVAAAQDREALAVIRADGPHGDSRLGGPCPHDPDERDDAVCVRGRMVGVVRPVDMLHAHPTYARILARTKPDRRRMQWRELYAYGDRWALFRVITCGACARVMGYAILVDVGALGADRRGALREVVGLFDGPILSHSPPEWVRHFRAGSPPPVPADRDREAAFRRLGIASRWPAHR